MLLNAGSNYLFGFMYFSLLIFLVNLVKAMLVTLFWKVKLFVVKEA
jgi:hypothetical protein